MSPHHQRSQPGPTGAAPYPSWAEITAEIGRATSQVTSTQREPSGRGWYDLLAGDGVPRQNDDPEPSGLAGGRASIP